MKKFYIETYGCQMNVYDSELIAGILEREPDFEAVERPEDADVILLNTCSVREHAEDKIYSRIGELQKYRSENPDLQLGVVGCMAQNLKEKLVNNRTHVQIVAGPDAYRRLPEMLSKKRTRRGKVDTHLSRYEVYDGLFPARREGINAWISIMRGCDKFCTYCIVPYTRGRERSRSIASITEEAALIAEQGFVEITLLGQNVNSYRHGEDHFPQLLRAVAQVPGIRRIRYTSPHPQDVDDDLLAVHAEFLPRIADHIHLPLQAGSDRMLKAMNRTYTRDHYLKLVEKIRKAVPSMSITTDIIVGFPGESEQDFQETLALMKDVKFDSAFTFKYSPRPGTKAALLTDDVPEAEKRARLNELIALQKEHTYERNLACVGRDMEILVERPSKKGRNELMGRTSSNRSVIFPAENYRIKDIITRKITEARGIGLYAG